MLSLKVHKNVGSQIHVHVYVLIYLKNITGDDVAAKKEKGCGARFRNHPFQIN